MPALTPAAEQAIQQLSQRYGVSQDAVRALLFAVANGGGTMAQFYHPELGGSGQWMRGGMTMVGDMFNYGLQNTVNQVCSELSNLLANQPVFVPVTREAGDSSSFGGGFGGGSNWWPAELGVPSATGGQNDSRYAYFPDTRRLAIQVGGRIALYDTLDHRIGGVQQQQGSGLGSLSFSSQYGTFTVESLPRVGGDAPGGAAPSPAPNAPAPVMNAPVMNAPAPVMNAPGSGSDVEADVFAKLEKLGQLRDKGIVTEPEFQAKKAELLARL